jgi:hypothetical protein
MCDTFPAEIPVNLRAISQSSADARGQQGVFHRYGRTKVRIKLTTTFCTVIIPLRPKEKPAMKEKFTATVWREGEWYIAQCREIEIASQGETKEEALRNLEEAIEVHFSLS